MKDIFLISQQRQALAIRTAQMAEEYIKNPKPFIDYSAVGADLKNLQDRLAKKDEDLAPKLPEQDFDAIKNVLDKKVEKTFKKFS